MSERSRREFAPRLLRWFGEHGRSLPWRDDPSPYRVVVSEFMLQQTQVERVVPSFERFVARFEGFSALACADVGEVIRLWRGLGYNTRAVRLHRLAQTVCERHRGQLPDREDELRALPGVGPYTARAILAFAFDRPTIAGDTNVRRVVQRVTRGIEWPSRGGAGELDASASDLGAGVSGFAFNSALMDLGATVCTARAPGCGACPIEGACAAGPIDAAQLATLARRHAPRRAPQQRLPFERTTRFLRGRIVDRLRALAPNERISFLILSDGLGEAKVRHGMREIERAVADLSAEGLVECRGGELSLARTSNQRPNA